MKTFYLLIIILSISLSRGFSQEYQKLYGSESNQIFNDLILTKDGSYIILGTKINENNDSSIIVLKVKQNGDILWTKNYSLENGVNPSSIIELENGNFLIAGFELNNTLNMGHARAEIFLNPMGEIISVLSHPDQRRGEAIQHIYTSDNSYILISNIGYTPTTQSIQITKRKFDFEKKWNRIWKRDNTDVCKKVFELEDGSFLILGETYSLGIRKDILLLKFNSLGHFAWAKALGKDQNESFVDAWKNTDGSILLLGSTNSFSPSTFREEILVTKIDTTGKTEWTKTYGANGSLRGKGIYKIGSNFHILADQNELSGNAPNMLYMQIDPAGNVLQSSSFSNESESNMKILQSFNGEILFGCTKKHEDKNLICLSKSNDLNTCSTNIILTSNIQELNLIDDPSDLAFSSLGGTEENLILSQVPNNIFSMETCLAANSNLKSSNNIKLYPNPFTDNVKLEGLNENVKVSIYDTSGKVIMQQFVKLGNYNLNLDKIECGIYFLKINGNITTKTIKIVKI